MWIALLIACLAVVLALVATAFAVHTWLHAPGARLWADLRLRVETLEWENEQRAARHRREVKVENVAKATVARQAKRSLEEEAQALLAAGAPAQRQPLTEEQQLAQVRAAAARLPH